MTVRERLAEYDGFVDIGILSHGFARFMRDYDVIFEALWGRDKWGDSKGTYRLRFTHCPEAAIVTKVDDSRWSQAWSDEFIDYARWEAAGEPEGFVWGTCWSNAFPGLKYLNGSTRAEHWSKRLGKTMHEISLETEAFELRVVFHDFTLTQLSDEVQVVDKVMFPIESDDAE